MAKKRAQAKDEDGADQEKPGQAQRRLDKDEQVIYDYLTKQNRPYSATDVHNNLHGAVSKTGVVRVLQTLADASIIRGKSYGKQLVYVARQDGADAGPTAEELESLDATISETQRQFQEQSATNNRLAQQLQMLSAAPTNDQLVENMTKLEKELPERRDRLLKLQSGGMRVDPQDRQQVLLEQERLTKLLRTRKRLCMDMVNSLMEGADVGRMTAGQFMEEMGCELDQ